MSGEKLSDTALEALAREAELIGKGGVSATKIIMWAEDNGELLASLIRAALQGSDRRG